MYPDPRPGVDPREVDIVVEGEFDGDRMVTSIEVIEHGRRASITWVEQQINKHRTLPTNKLILISKSGFSSNALAAVAAEGGWVQTITPTAVERDGEELTWSFYIDQIQLTPTICRMNIDEADGPLTVRALADNVIFSASEEGLGFAVDLAREAVGIPWLIKTFEFASHNHPERHELRGFTCGMAVAGLDYFLRNDATESLHRILAIDVEGTFSWEQEELKFVTRDFGGRQYSSGEGVLFGRKGVWVATKDQNGATTFSWRMEDGGPLHTGQSNPGPLKFPALLSLEPPPGWDIEAGGFPPLASG